MEIEVIHTCIINIDYIKAQYNPNRFRALMINSDSTFEPLAIGGLPHINLINRYINDGRPKTLATIDSSPYGKMQKRYGHILNEIENRAKRLFALYEDIKINGLKERPEIMIQPLLQNDYNDSYEIYEGHHRLACCYVLNQKYVEVDVCRRVK
jgi:hypothetical protein